MRADATHKFCNHNACSADSVYWWYSAELLRRLHANCKTAFLFDTHTTHTNGTTAKHNQQLDVFGLVLRPFGA